MMTIEVENEETTLCIKECSKRLNAKVTNLLQEKSEAPDASDESSTKVNIRTNVLIFYTKQAITCRHSATKIFQSFVDQKHQIQISLSIVKLSE